MIDADQDHDEQTEPAARFPVISPARLAELAELCTNRPHGWHLTTDGTAEVAELVRLYRGVTRVAESLDHIGRIGDALERQVDAAETVAESVLRGAHARFQISLKWGSTLAGFPITSTGWHETPGGMRWTGTFDEALEIVRQKYGPKRGTDAEIVVRLRVDELEQESGI